LEPNHEITKDIIGVIEICTAFIAAVLGIAYPILLQVIQHFDKKYHSERIINIFKDELEYRFFKISLYLTLIITLSWIIIKYYLGNSTLYNINLEHSAIWLLLISTSILVIIVIKLINKIFIYLNFQELPKHIIEKLDIILYESFDPTKVYQINNFEAITDLLIYSVRQQDDRADPLINDFFYKIFSKWRELNPNKPYPTEYYKMIYKTTEELVGLKNNKLKLTESSVASQVWLFGDYLDTTIQEETYRWLWEFLIIPIDNEKDKWIMNYWETAHQYFTYSLQKIYPEYSESDWQICNQVEINKREKERERFLEFHYVLGGLLMYRQRYDCIRRIFNYSMSEPPDYVLLPKTMDDIFEGFFKFRNPLDNRIHIITDIYNFPDLEGTNSDSTIKGWISKYFALLFIRQFTLQPYMINPIKKPRLPETQRQKKLWTDYLDYFEKLVSDIINDEILLKKVGFEYINDNWFEINKIKNPTLFLEELKLDLEKSFETALTTQELSERKLNLFLNVSSEIITKTFKDYENLNNINISGTDFTPSYPTIRRQLFEKSAFADHQEADYSNFDSFHAEIISTDFKRAISNSYYSNKSGKYLIKQEEIFKAIDRLQINGNDFIAVGFRQNLEYYIKVLKIPYLSLSNYNNLNIANLKFSNTVTFNSFFILHKEDLPFIEYSKIGDETITKFDLKCINEKYKIYANVINLNERKDILSEVQESYPSTDLTSSVLSVISYDATIKWKKKIKCVQIQAYSEYYHKESPNSLDDIKKF